MLASISQCIDNTRVGCHGEIVQVQFWSLSCKKNVIKLERKFTRNLPALERLIVLKKGRVGKDIFFLWSIGGWGMIYGMINGIYNYDGHYSDWSRSFSQVSRVYLEGIRLRSEEKDFKRNWGKNVFTERITGLWKELPDKAAELHTIVCLKDIWAGTGIEKI